MIVRSNRKLEVFKIIEKKIDGIFKLISLFLKITKKRGKAKFLLFENSFKVDHSENATKKSSVLQGMFGSVAKLGKRM